MTSGGGGGNPARGDSHPPNYTRSISRLSVLGGCHCGFPRVYPRIRIKIQHISFVWMGCGGEVPVPDVPHSGENRCNLV
jgi:hypothetical protein